MNRVQYKAKLLHAIEAQWGDLQKASNMAQNGMKILLYSEVFHKCYIYHSIIGYKG